MAEAKNQVTVVIPTKDRPTLAERAICSALVQDGVDVEVIVIDDGSAPPFRPRVDDPRVRFLRRETPGGPCAARNLGLTAATGSWVTFLDDDDELAPGALRGSLAAARRSDLPPPVAVMSTIEVRDAAGRPLRRRRPNRLPRGSAYFLESGEPGATYWTHNSLVAPTDVVRAIGGWNEDLLSFEQDDFFLRLNAICSLERREDVGYYITDHGDERRSGDLEAAAWAMERILELHRASFIRHRRKHARYTTAMGITHLRAGRWFPAVRGTARALRIDPTSARGWAMFLAALAGPATWRTASVLKRAALARNGRSGRDH